uniref:MCM OB domain-containing protein n=1 Tax=Schistosoma curassoni TaxID=6186 RepID=A0A183L4A2_9TREM
MEAVLQQIPFFLLCSSPTLPSETRRGIKPLAELSVTTPFRLSGIEILDIGDTARIPRTGDWVELFGFNLSHEVIEYKPVVISKLWLSTDPRTVGSDEAQSESCTFNSLITGMTSILLLILLHVVTVKFARACEFILTGWYEENEDRLCV